MSNNESARTDLSQTREIVERFEDVGVPMPARCRAVLKAADEIPTYESQKRAIIDQVCAGVAAGKVDKAVSDRLATMIAADPALSDELAPHVERAALEAVLAAYPLDTAFAAIAKRFNEAAEAFVKAASAVDSEAAPDELDEKAFAAWKAIPALSQDLGAAAGLFEGLLRLYGRSAEGDEHVLLCSPVSVARGVHGSRRARGGWWADVLAAGATIGVTDSLSEFLDRHASGGED